MTSIKSTIDEQEVNKFAEHADHWWDRDGPLKTLHDINAVRLQFIQKHVDLANKKVLDVGCGGGILSEALATVGAKVTGIDAASSAIAVAKQHAKENQLDIRYHTKPIESYTGLGVELITCMEMLEHVPEPELVIAHCKRILKPDGLLFLSTINRTVKAYATAIVAAEYVLGILPKQTHDYEKFLKPSELSTMAQNVGLQLLDMQGIGYNPFTRQAWLCSDISVNYVMVFGLMASHS